MLGGVVAIEAAAARVCALTQSGIVYCWGRWDRVPPRADAPSERGPSIYREDWVDRHATRVFGIDDAKALHLEPSRHADPLSGGRAWALDREGAVHVWGGDAFAFAGPPWKRTSRATRQTPLRTSGVFATGCRLCWVEHNSLLEVVTELEGGRLHLGVVEHVPRLDAQGDPEAVMVKAAGRPEGWCGMYRDGSVVCTQGDSKGGGDGETVAPPGWETREGGATIPIAWAGSGSVPRRTIEVPARVIALPGPATQLVRSPTGWVARLEGGRVVELRAPQVDHPDAPFEVTEVAELSRVRNLEAGPDDVCALNGDGDAICWAPGSSESRRYTGLGAPVALARGRDVLCALQSDGVVQCVGRNDEGQCGAGSLEERLQQPEPVRLKMKRPPS